MSPPNRESVAEIARATGITRPTLYHWRSQCKKQGQLVPASKRPPEQWSAADKLSAVIQAASLSGNDPVAFCRERDHSSPATYPLASGLASLVEGDHVDSQLLGNLRNALAVGRPQG